MTSICFWQLTSHPESSRRLAEWDPDVMDIEQILCSADPSHRRGGKRLTNLSVLLPRGIVQDFTWTWQGECLMKDRVVDLFQQEGFTGFSIKTVKARFKNGANEPPTLWELVRTGWGGLAKSESGITRTRYCHECKSVRYSGVKDARQLIDELQWDGTDFFIVWPMPRFIFVSDRVASFVQKHRFTGVILKSAEELKQDPAIIDGYSPGRLSDWMSECRARELGEAAGIAEI
jgi:hypothetical protein